MKPARAFAPRMRSVALRHHAGLVNSPEPRHVTKQQYVYATLREAILRGNLGPGERLIIDDVARRLDTSIIPVREALRLLESEALVVNVAHVGATVAAISRESVMEIFTVLEGLEMVSSRAAAQRAMPADLEALGAIVRSMDASLAAGRPDQWAVLNTRFHLGIATRAGMPMLEQMLRRALDHWDRVRRHFFKGVLAHRAELAQREHHEILAQMQARDLDALERLVRRHNQAAMSAYAEYLGGSRGSSGAQGS